MTGVGSGRGWSEWRPAEAPYTLGVEEEVMLLAPGDWSLAQASDAVLPALGPLLERRCAGETHASALELQSGVHRTVSGAAAELAQLRRFLADELDRVGLRTASAGTHPFTTWRDTRNSGGDRYQLLYRSLRELARREPTFSLHVHVGVQDVARAVPAMNRLRDDLPLLLALSASSPYWQGRDTGLASARTSIFQAFPRVGPPRAFADYADYVGTIDGLIECGAIPEPTFVWWDARLQPRFGTLEVRVMDAQPSATATAALAALAQCLVKRAVEAEHDSTFVDHPEMLAENRFLAARDGPEAVLIDPARARLLPLRAVLETRLAECEGHARELGCTAELDAVAGLVERPGPAWQREVAAREGSRGLTAALADAFAAAVPTAGAAPA